MDNQFKVQLIQSFKLMFQDNSKKLIDENDMSKNCFRKL